MSRLSRAPARGLRLSVVSLAFSFGCGLDAEGTGPRANDAVPAPGEKLDAGDEPTGTVRPRPDAGTQVALDARVSLPPLPTDAQRPPVDGPDATSRDAASLTDAAALSDAAQSDAAQSDAGVQTDAQVPVSCEVAGTYAIRYDFDVTWPQTMYLATYPVYAAGAGRFSLLARMTIAPNAGAYQATLAPCSVALPDVAGADPAVLTERYGSVVPNASWSSASMPSWQVAAAAPCAGPGCAFSLDPLVAILGGKLLSVGADGTPLVELVDHDADGALGLTTVSRGPTEQTASGKNYSYITLGTEARARKQRVVLAMFGRAEGTFQSCDALSGSTANAAASQTMVGCTGVVRGTTNEVTCDEATARFFSATSPVWELQSASFRAVRIGDASCITARTALP